MREREGMVFAIGLVAIGIVALVLKQTELASIAVGAIAGMFVPNGR